MGPLSPDERFFVSEFFTDAAPSTPRAPLGAWREAARDIPIWGQ